MGAFVTGSISGAVATSRADVLLGILSFVSGVVLYKLGRGYVYYRRHKNDEDPTLKYEYYG